MGAADPGGPGPEAPPQATGLDERAEAEVRFAVLAELSARIVYGDRDWPW
jgi:hypothetical protein